MVPASYVTISRPAGEQDGLREDGLPHWLKGTRCRW